MGSNMVQIWTFMLVCVIYFNIYNNYLKTIQESDYSTCSLLHIEDLRYNNYHLNIIVIDALISHNENKLVAR